MKREVVEAVNGQSITTESGEKICIGNHAFDVGESVWVDGRYAFGNDRKATAPVAHEIDEGTKKKHFIWVGYYQDEDGSIYYKQRIYDDKLNYVEIENKTLFPDYESYAFCYNAKGTKLAWLRLGYYKEMLITIATKDGIVQKTIKTPSYPYAADCYFDENDDLIWKCAASYGEYTKEFLSTVTPYTPVTIIDTAGAVFFSGKNFDLTETKNIVPDLQSNVDNYYSEMEAACTSSNLSLSVSWEYSNHTRTEHYIYDFADNEFISEKVLGGSLGTRDVYNARQRTKLTGNIYISSLDNKSVFRIYYGERAVWTREKHTETSAYEARKLLDYGNALSFVAPHAFTYVTGFNTGVAYRSKVQDRLRWDDTDETNADINTERTRLLGFSFPSTDTIDYGAFTYNAENGYTITIKPFNMSASLNQLSTQCTVEMSNGVNTITLDTGYDWIYEPTGILCCESKITTIPIDKSHLVTMSSGAYEPVYNFNLTDGTKKELISTDYTTINRRSILMEDVSLGDLTALLNVKNIISSS